MTGCRVVVFAVFRGGSDADALAGAAQICGLERGDRLDVTAIIAEPDGTKRVSWCTADLRPC